MKSYDELKEIVEQCNKNIFDVISIDSCVRLLLFKDIDGLDINKYLTERARDTLKTKIESDLHMLKYAGEDMYYGTVLKAHLKQLEKLI